MSITTVFTKSTKTARKCAISCPGQGLNVLAALAGFRKHKHLFTPILNEVDDALGENLSQSLFDENPQLDLMRTYYAQPAILTATASIHEYIRRVHGIDLIRQQEVEYILGHSLGEYSALAVSGMLSIGTAVQLVRQRAQLMENLVANSDSYEMKALMFREPSFEKVLKHCHDSRILANVNTRQQIVVAGEKLKLQAVLDQLPKRTVAKVATLPVRIPFHNELLRPVEAKLLKWIASREIKLPIKPFVLNLTGEISLDPQHILSSILRTNSRPVQWVSSMEALQAEAVDTVYALGPGEVLSGLNSKFVESIPLSEP